MVDARPKTGRKNGLNTRHYTRPGMSVGGYNHVADLDCFGRTCQVRLSYHGNQSFKQGAGGVAQPIAAKAGLAAWRRA